MMQENNDPLGILNNKKPSNNGNDPLGILKKKETTVLPSEQKPKPTSLVTQPKGVQKPSVSSVSGKPEGFYAYPGNILSVYQKTKDGWLVDWNRTGNFVELSKGDVEKRVRALEKNAKTLYDSDYQKKSEPQVSQYITEPKAKPTLEQQMKQELFKEEFFVTPKKNMSSVEQVGFVAKERAKKELGENADPKALLQAEEKYKSSETLKMLKRKGYDVDVNASIEDPKAKKALAEFEASEQLKLRAESKQEKLSQSVDNVINSKLLNLTEEAAVPLLNKQFGRYGFVFEESGFGDAMVVKYSPDGINYTDELDIDLQSTDAVTQSNLLKTFINKKYLNDSEVAALNDEKLDAKKLINITSSDPYKYAEYSLSEKEFENYITSEYRNINSKKIRLDDKINEFQKLSSKYNTSKNPELLSQLNSMEADIKKDQRQLVYDVASIEETENKYKQAVGLYALQKEKEGNFLGGITASIAKGVTAAERAVMNVGIDIFSEMLPNAGLNPVEYQQLKDEGLTDNQISNQVSSKLKREIGKEVNQGIANIGSLGTVQNEYFSSVDRNILEKAVFGLSESVGAAVSGGGNKVAQGLAFFSMSYDAMQDELSSKEFDELSKWEKQGISGVYGLAIGQLEKLGFDASAGNVANPLVKKLVSNAVAKAVKEMPENAAIETVDQLIGTSLKNTMKAAGLKVANGAVSEGATEGVQSLAETSMKNIVNAIHDKKVFQYVPDLTTKEGVVEALNSALYDAAAGAIGGAIMGSFSSYQQASLNERTDDKFQTMYDSLMDDNTLRAVKLNEVEKYKNGSISKEQMQSNIGQINQTVGLLNKIPAELETRSKKIAFDLLSEREGLQSKIQGKEPNLVSTEINRISEIDNQLKTIGENAVKESTKPVEEVTAEGGGVQYQGTESRQPEVGQGEGAVGQAAQPETDLGNRPVEGRSIKEIGDEATQEVNTYIAELGSKERIGKDVDNVISKMNNAEYINDSEINSTIDTIFNEVESINNNSDYSDQTKKALSEKLMNIAEQLDNYEFRTKTETISFAQRGTTPSVTESPTTKVQAEKFFDGQKAEVNGLPATFTSKNGRTEALMGNGEVIVLDTPTMKINEGDFEFDDAGSLTAVTVTDRFGTTAKFTGDIAMDLAIKQRENEIGTVEQAEFDTVYKEVETKYIKQKSPTTEVTSKEKKGPEAVIQEETAPDIVPTEPTVAEEVVAKQPVAEEVERLGKLLEGTDQQIDEQIGTLNVSKKNNKVAQSIANAAKAIAKILPDVKFIVHDTDESYRKASSEQGRSQSTAGEYNPKTRTIQINGTKANNRTAAHEVFHAVILEGVKNNAEAARLTKAMIYAVRKSLVNVDEAGSIIAYLNDFASNYEKNIQNEEKLAELFATLSDNYATLPAPTQSLIRRFLDRIAKMFGLKTLTDREVIDFMNVVSQKVARGEEIQAKEISGISRRKIKEFPTSGVSVQGLKVNTSKVSPEAKTARKQIIGENAQLAQDVRDNLQVARDMETAGKGAKTIRIATGWEKGKDGKWRYEIPDIELSKYVKKYFEKGLNPQAGAYLRFVINDVGGLFEKYPKLNKTRFEFYDGERRDAKGSYDSKTNTISVNRLMSEGEIRSTIAHEIQHAIQDIEGFAIGGNVEMMRTPDDALEYLANKLPATLTRAEKSLIKDEYEKNGLTRLPILPTSLDVASDSISTIEDFIDKLDVLVKLFPNEISYKNLQDALDLKLMEMGGKDIAFEKYQKLAGEVESRNVEKRIKMTPEQRRQATLQETEDVAREDQIIFFEGQEQKSTRQQIDNSFEARNQKPIGVENIIFTARNNGFSDAAIREYLKQKNGLSDKEATEAINKYNIKEEDIWIPSEGKLAERIASSLQSFRKRLFSARSFLPKSVFAYKEEKEASISSHLNIVDQNVTDFNRLYKKYNGDKKQLRKDFDSYIRGNKDVKLPNDFKEVANSMRNQIDGLSQQLIDNGLVDTDLAQTIKDNLGKYLTRSYKVYDRENWANEVEEEVKQKAINFLKEQYRPIAKELAEKQNMPIEEALDNLVNNKLNEMLNKLSATKFIKGSKLGSKDLSVLKEKNDIPLEIRALMGEYADPALNYAKTILKMASLAANHNFLTQVKEAGMEKYFFEKNDPRRGKEFNTKIAAEGSETMNPLNGLYTTKEIAEAFEAQPNQLNDFMQTFMKLQSGIRWAKTIGSIGTHFKNVIGNLGFIWINAHFGEMGKAFMVVKNDLAKSNNKERRDLMNKYIKLGIVKQSAGLGEIMDMFKDANFDTAMASRLSNEKIGLLGKAKRFLFQGKKFAEDMYQAEDDFFKIVAYENELSRYSNALFGKSKKDLTEQELSEVNKLVTEIVKNTYPTYDRIPNAIKLIRRVPFIGNFISFQAEAYRTAFNTAALAKEELSSENPEIKRIGAMRLAGSTTYISAKTAILQYFGMAAGTGLTGAIGYLFDDDEEEKRDKDIRQFVAPWSKESDLIVIQVGNGKLKYIDFSATDPHGGMKKAINAFLLGESTVDSFVDGLIGVVQPFIGEEMTTEALLALKNNRDKYGKEIWNPESSTSEKIKSITDEVYKLIEPGTISSIRRGIASEDKTNELIANLVGLRTYDVDINKQFGFKTRDFSERIKNAKRIYNSAFYNEKSTDKDKEKAYKKANEKLKSIYGDLIDVYNSAERLGVDPKDLENSMKEYGDISKKDISILKSGEIPELKIKEEEE